MVDKLTEEQIAEFKSAFTKFDKKGDGKMSAAELGDLLASMGQTPNEADLQLMIDSLDKNKNGLLEFNEFLELMVNTMRESSCVDEILDAFRVFDPEGDGLVNAMELRHALTTLGDRLTEEEVDELIREAEVDANGNIDYLDFIAKVSPKV